MTEFAPGFVASVLASGIFLLVGLITGVWKYLQMKASAEGQAHLYVDTAHRASLLYSFAALVIAQLVELSALSDTVNLAAALAPLVFFAIAIITYLIHGIRKDTDNQIRDGGAVTHLGMWALIVAEIGGVAVLFVGVCLTFFG